MAGLYPDAPGMKFQYHVDGSSGFDAGGTTFTSGLLSSLNDETQTNDLYWGNGGVSYVGIVFPQLRDLAGIFYVVPDQSFASAFAISTSPDTTNGIDGTWTVRSTATPATGVSQYRTGITTLAVTGIKAIRAGISATISTNGNRYMTGLHLYGSIPASSTPDRLTLWHPTLNQELGGAALDFSDTARTYTFDKTFRVKNLSSSLTANSILLTTTALTDTSPTVVSQLTLSQGSGFASTQTITSLAPGAISAVCTVRFTVLSTATVGLWRQRVAANAGSWT